MVIENSFTVACTPDDVYAMMVDVERVAPCIPGATLVGQREDGGYDAQVAMKMGPLRLTYAGSVVIAERDDAARRAVMDAKGAEQRGQGQAQASMTMLVTDVGEGNTSVKISSDLLITGRVAQMGRGIMEDVAKRMMRDMARCIEAKLSGTTEADLPASKPIGGLGLAAGVLWDKVSGKD